MKKSSFVAMIMSVVGGILISVGMCCCLLPEWNAFVPGVVMGVMGLVVLISMAVVWRRMESKAPIVLDRKKILSVALGVVGALVLGVGMCMTMLWELMIPGILVGIVGIVALVSLVPVVKGIY